MKRFHLIFTLLCLLASSASAGSLEDAVDSMAKKISSYLTEKGQRQILLKDFEGPGTASAGRAIRVSLKDALTKSNVQVVSLGANWTVRGEFISEPTAAGMIVLIKAKLVDANGREIGDFRQKVQDERVSSIEDIVRLLGTTVELEEEQEAVAKVNESGAKKESDDTSSTLVSKSSDLTQKIQANKDLTDKIADSVVTPTFAFRDPAKTIVSPESTSKFRMEMLVCPAAQTTFSPIAIEDQGGFPFAPVEAQDTYKIRVHNDADHAVGVKLSIDGINSFALADDPSLKDLGTWYIPAKSAGVIPGWFVNGTLAKEFVVTANGEQLNLPNAADIGTVTAMFFHAWLEGEPEPAVERLAKSRGQLRTGIGRDIVRQGGFQQSFFGQTLLSSISIRYSNPDDLPPSAP